MSAATAGVGGIPGCIAAASAVKVANLGRTFGGRASVVFTRMVGGIGKCRSMSWSLDEMTVTSDIFFLGHWPQVSAASTTINWNCGSTKRFMNSQQAAQLPTSGAESYPAMSKQPAPTI